LNLLPTLIISLPGKCIPDLNGICLFPHYKPTSIFISVWYFGLRMCGPLHLWLYTPLWYYDYNWTIIYI